MAISLEGLEFEIESKTTNSVNSIDTLIQRLTDLKNVTKGGIGLDTIKRQIDGLDKTAKTFNTSRLTAVRNGLRELSAGLHEISVTDVENLNYLANVLSSMRGLNAVKISATVPNRLREISEAMRSYEWSDIEKLQALRDVLADINNNGNMSILRVSNQSQQAILSNATAQSPTVETSGQLQQKSSSDRVTPENVTGDSAETEKQASKLKDFRKVLNGVKREFDKTTRSVFKFFRALGKKQLSRFIKSLTKATSGLGRFFNSMKRILMYRAIRAILSTISKGFQEGISNLYQWSLVVDRTFANSMDKIATSMLYLKNSIAAMVAPLINALAPAIDFVVDKFVVLLNKANEVFAKLTGADTYTVAKKVATEWGKAEEDVKQAVEGIKRYTLGFDELNILGKPDKDKGSSEKDAVDYSSMFENLPVSTAISTFVDRMKDAFQSENWKELGTIIGNKVNEMVDNINWAETGTKVGNGINGAIQTAYYTLSTINFTNIGAKIAEFFNNALEEIDFEVLGRLLVRKVTAIIDTVIGFLTNVDWALVGRKLSDGIKGALDEATKWLESHDWKKTGEEFGENFKKFTDNVDWSGIAKDIWQFTCTALVSTISFVGSLLKSSGIGSLFSDVFISSITDGKENSTTIGTKLGTWIARFNENLKEAFKTTNWGSWWSDLFFEKLTGGRLDSTKVGQWWWTNFWAKDRSISKNIDTFMTALVQTFVSTKPIDITTWWSDLLIKTVSGGKLDSAKVGQWWWDNFWSPAVKLKNQLTEWWNTFLRNLSNAFANLNIADWWKKNVLDKVATAALNADFSKFKDSGKNIITGLYGGIKAKITNVKTWIDTNVIKPFIQGIKDLLGIHSPSTVMSGIGTDTIDGFLIALAAPFKIIGKWVDEKIVTPLKEAIEKKDLSAPIKLIKSGWSSVTGWIKSFFGTTNLDGSVGLEKKKYFKDAGSVTGWIKKSFGTENLDGQVGLQRSGWSYVSSWITESYMGGVVDKDIGLKQSNYWTDVAEWIKRSWLGGIVDKVIGLTQASYWTDVAEWIKKSWLGGVIDKIIGLKQASYWTDVAAWIKKSWLGGVLDKTIGLTQADYWTTVTGWIKKNWLGSGVIDIGVQLFKAGWNSLREFFGLSEGGYSTGHGFKLFKSGGAITSNGSEFWNSIPKYASGQTGIHGSMFVAGESGAELVGHVNGRTEVLNKSQLGQIMHSAIINGMAQYTGYFRALHSQMATCTNAIISAYLTTSEMVNKHLDKIDVSNYAYADGSAFTANGRINGIDEDGITDSVYEGVREGMAEAMARQNDLLRDQNEILRQILSKETGTIVDANMMVDMLNRKNQRDGRSVVPLNL